MNAAAQVRAVRHTADGLRYVDPPAWRNGSGHIRIDRVYLYPLLRNCTSAVLLKIILLIEDLTRSSPGSPEFAQVTMDQWQALTGDSERSIELQIAEGEAKGWISRERPNHRHHKGGYKIMPENFGKTEIRPPRTRGKGPPRKDMGTERRPESATVREATSGAQLIADRLPAASQPGAQLIALQVHPDALEAAKQCASPCGCPLLLNHEINKQAEPLASEGRDASFRLRNRRDSRLGGDAVTRSAQMESPPEAKGDCEVGSGSGSGSSVGTSNPDGMAEPSGGKGQSTVCATVGNERGVRVSGAGQDEILLVFGRTASGPEQSLVSATQPPSRHSCSVDEKLETDYWTFHGWLFKQDWAENGRFLQVANDVACVIGDLARKGWSMVDFTAHCVRAGITIGRHIKNPIGAIRREIERLPPRAYPAAKRAGDRLTAARDIMPDDGRSDG